MHTITIPGRKGRTGGTMPAKGSATALVAKRRRAAIADATQDAIHPMLLASSYTADTGDIR